MGGVEVGPARVWLPDVQAPGLAMSRSMGDYVAQSVGVTPDPEINIYDVHEDDRFMVIASDGVWEFLSNEDVAKIVAPFYNAGQAEQAANQVVRESANQWKMKEEVIDDITCVIVFLDTKLIERSLKYRQAQIDNLISQHKETDQEHSIFVQPLNKHFLDYNLDASYEGGVKK